MGRIVNSHSYTIGEIGYKSKKTPEGLKRKESKDSDINKNNKQLKKGNVIRHWKIYHADNEK